MLSLHSFIVQNFFCFTKFETELSLNPLKEYNFGKNIENFREYYWAFYKNTMNLLFWNIFCDTRDFNNIKMRLLQNLCSSIKIYNLMA